MKVIAQKATYQWSACRPYSITGFLIANYESAGIRAALFATAEQGQVKEIGEATLSRPAKIRIAATPLNADLWSPSWTMYFTPSRGSTDF